MLDSLLLEKLTRCPRCASTLELTVAPRCTNSTCIYCLEAFPLAGSQPVLIDFDNSIVERSAYLDGSGSVLPRDDSGRSFRTRLRDVAMGSNKVARTKCAELLLLIKSTSPSPIVLVIGGGAIGAGASALYEDTAVTVVGTDIYASANTHLLADGHALPFHDGVFDAVWIQAVLEHVLNPIQVVGEIHRVLKPEAYVYAETPFMQQVHEGAYDFTRFTHSGHRWLFRRFEQIDSGPVAGPGVALMWSVRAILRALGVNSKAATALMLPLFWLRFLDAFARPGLSADGASCIYFLGRKWNQSLSPKDMVSYYHSSR
jgi:SAM-dependent methyltransferase